MAKIKSVEDYIKDYLKERAMELGTQGFSKWLSQNGEDSVRNYAKSMQKIDTGYAKALSTYGKEADALGGAGLSDGGYARYIDELARDRRKKDGSEAIRDAYVTMAKNARGYGNYLDDTDARSKKLRASAFNTLTGEKIIDYELAYERAIELGLSDSDARDIASRATESVITKHKNTVMKAIVSKVFTRSQAEEYAKAFGLPEEIVKELGDYADSINKQVLLGSAQDIIDYINAKK